MADKVTQTMSKVDSLIQEKDFYTALQRYHTYISRSQKKKQYELAEGIIVQASSLLLDNGEVSGGSDLALCIVPLYQEWSEDPATDITVDSERLQEKVLEINSHYPSEMTALDYQSQRKFLKEALELSSKFGPYKFGQPDLNWALGTALLNAKETTSSNTYLLHTHRPEEFATQVFNQAAEGYKSELDLFYAKAVLQLLCVDNLKDANEFSAKFMELVKANNEKLESPLVNFIGFLLETLQRDAYPLFKLLQERYKPSLMRDTDFMKYMDHIGFNYFGVKPRKTGLAAMMDSVMGMFGPQ